MRKCSDFFFPFILLSKINESLSAFGWNDVQEHRSINNNTTEHGSVCACVCGWVIGIHTNVYYDDDSSSISFFCFFFVFDNL